MVAVPVTEDHRHADTFGAGFRNRLCRSSSSHGLRCCRHSWKLGEKSTLRTISPKRRIGGRGTIAWSTSEVGVKAELSFGSLEKSRAYMKIRRGPSGFHLFERGTGLNVLLDEVSPPPELWAVAPRNVSVSLTNACDLSCQYCFAPKHHAKLDVAQLVAWMDELDASGCLGVGFGGGEPTLHPELEAICRHGAKNTGLSITLTTHAHRLTDRLAAVLAGNIHFIRVSMDRCRGYL